MLYLARGAWPHRAFTGNSGEICESPGCPAVPALLRGRRTPAHPPFDSASYFGRTGRTTRWRTRSQVPFEDPEPAGPDDGARADLPPRRSDLAAFEARFSTEEACREYLIRLRW